MGHVVRFSLLFSLLAGGFLLVRVRPAGEPKLKTPAGVHLRGPEAVEALKKQGAYESLRKAFEAARYRVASAGQPNQYRAGNRAQGLEVEFAPEGIRLKHSEGALGMRLTGYGYGERWRKPDPAAPVVKDGHRVEYRRGGLTEWYVNEARGLEQGFTLERRPGQAGAGEPLVLVLETSGELRPVAAGEDVELRAGTQTALRYAGLKTWDARGRELPGRLEVHGREVRIMVEDAAAEYPLTVDPLFTEGAKLTAADGAENDNFGVSVALSGDTALIGALADDVGANLNQGSAYVFVRSGSTWSQQAQLTASDGTASDYFGVSVALSGDTALVGAHLDAVGGNTYRGSAYVFVRSGSTWSQEQKLTASDGAAGDVFGHSVALSGDTALVGAYLGDVGANSNQGSAYVFVRSGSTWSQQQKLTASDGAADDEFGYSVAMSGDTALVGAYRGDVGANSNQGSAYVFVRSGATWSQQQKLTASDGAAGDEFGSSVAVSGDTALVGAHGDDVGANANQGSAYVFARSGTTWTQQANLTASDGAANDYFGASAALSGDTALVGAQWDTVGANTYQGSAYVFVRSGINWSQQAHLTASDGAASDSFGRSVALSRNTTLAGAYLDDTGGNTDQGSAYVNTGACPFTLAPSEPVRIGVSGAAGQTTTITVDTGCAWTAVSNSAWITITGGSSGTGNGTVTYTVMPNPTSFPRTGMITIAGDTYLVLQAAPPLVDFNGDGNADILWRNRTTGQNQVWFMNGAGYLGPGSVIPVSDVNWKLVASADFNSDGKPDLLWRHAVTGENIVWFMNGTSYAGQAWLSTVADVNYHIVAVADFNNDGKPDLLWRHYGTGQNIIWYMNGTNVTGVDYPPAVADTAWKIVGAADFNADGKPDIVWRHATTGANAVWYMNGAAYAGQAALPSVTDMNWKIAGVADYNSDGKTDLLWHSLATGANIQWFLNGVNYSGTGYPPNQSTDWAPLGDYDPVATATTPVTDFDRDGHPDLLWRHATSGQNLMWFLDGVDYDDQASLITVADSNWKVVAIADFNGDGNPDLLWRHYGTGQNTIWYMNVASIAGMGHPPAVSDVNWKIVGAADFNGDGKQDILWRHALSGEVLVWYMNGTSYTGQTSITTVADLNYKIGAIADFNGDGKPDILWRHYGTGQNIVWYMNGASVAGVGYPPSVGDTGWMIAGAADFNADGQTDIVWRHATTGANAVWYMNGMSYLGYGALPAVTDTNWKIAMGGE